MEEPEEIALFNTLVPLAGMAVVIALGVILMVVQFQRSLLKQRLQKENLKMKHQQDLLRTSIAVQEKERQRIAGDLHDELGARLSVALMQLKHAKNNPNDISSHMGEEMEKHLESALQSTKRISYELMPPQLVNLGLYKALLVLMEDIRKAGGLRVEAQKSGDPDSWPWPIQLGLFRMLSEMLNNTLKHAEATEVQIELQESENAVLCHYKDNGKGLPKTAGGTGLGLQNLEGRAQALSGMLQLSQSPGGGFMATIELPLTSKPLEHDNKTTP